MNILRSLILMIVVAIFTGCSVRHHKKILFSGESLASQNIPLKLEGFYYAVRSDSSSIIPVILYEDGLVINERYFEGSSSYCIDTSQSLLGNSSILAVNRYKSYLVFLKNSYLKIPSSCKIRYNDVDGKGIFQIKNDSIKIQYYNAEMQIEGKDSFNSYYLFEYRGVINNDEKFHITKIFNYRKNTSEKVDLIFHFEPDRNKPAIKNMFLK